VKPINNCTECPSKCCFYGNPPYEIVIFKEFVKTFYKEGFSKQCINYDSVKQNCKVWGTKYFPPICRVHTCSLREFTKEEELKMSMVETIPCKNCGNSFVYIYEQSEDYFVEECDSCGSIIEYDRLRKGNGFKRE